MDYLNDNNVIHRDINFNTILLTSNEANDGKYIVKLSGFHFSKRKGAHEVNI